MTVVSFVVENRFVKRFFRFSVCWAMALLWLFLPLMHGAEGGAMYVVRGFNLVEFSWWGGVAVVLPLLTPLLLRVVPSCKGRTVLLLCLSFVHAACCTMGMAAAYKWLSAVGVPSVRWHNSTALLYLTFPFAVPAGVLLLKSKRRSEKAEDKV